MAYDAMIVIDMQNALVKAHPYNEKGVIENIKRLLEACRQNHIPVIYVRHDGGIEDELEYNTEGWQIYSEIAPTADEPIFDKCYNSAFRKTKLKEYLDEHHMKNLILVGMQSEFCMDTSCKVAFEYGYELCIPKDTTTTFDGPEMSGEARARFYEEQIWKGRFAKVEEVERVIKEIQMPD